MDTPCFWDSLLGLFQAERVNTYKALNDFCRNAHACHHVQRKECGKCLYNYLEALNHYEQMVVEERCSILSKKNENETIGLAFSVHGFCLAAEQLTEWVEENTRMRDLIAALYDLEIQRIHIHLSHFDDIYYFIKYHSDP